MAPLSSRELRMRCLRGCEVRSLRGSKLGVRWLDNGIGLRECEIRSSRVRQFHGIGDDDSRCLDKAAACNTTRLMQTPKPILWMPKLILWMPKLILWMPKLILWMPKLIP